MKLELSSIRAAALLAFAASAEAAGHGHGHHHGRRHHHRDAPDANITIEKRGGQCQFPSDVGLVAVTPNLQNAGWAMSPNQPCLPGNYCPYACPPGQVSMQWDPEATSYTYPLSMNGGLYCDDNGNIHKPFPDRPYCQEGSGAVTVANKCGKEVSFCQTVLPGNEAMLIPTLVSDLATLAVPGTDYWCDSAAHYYVNPPGISTEVGCVWGSPANPYGNWSPYVAGANTVGNGDTYVKLGWNPIYLEPTTPFRDVVPDYGISIECEGAGCNGLPCKIDPAVNNVNEMIGGQASGAGGGNFCVVTVPKGKKANFVVFEKDGGQGGGQGAPPTTVAVPTSSSSSTTSDTPSTTSTPEPTPTTTSTPTPTPSTSTPEPDSSTSSAAVLPSSVLSPNLPLSSMMPSLPAPSSGMWPMQSPTASYTAKPNVFMETGGAASPSSSAPSASSTSSASPASTSSSSASTCTASMGLVLGVLAAVLNW